MSSFWKDKRVVVTGGTGMVGRFLCKKLLDDGARVLSLSRSPYDKEHLYRLEHFSGDATSLNTCKCAFVGADAVFNLAASVGGVYFNADNHSDQLWSNAKLGVVPAIAAKECDVPIFLQVSSVCVYADQYNNPAVEENGLLGVPSPANAGYAWAKRFSETATHLVFQNSNTEYVIVRPTNMYGEGDNFGEGSHVVPSLVRQFVDNDQEVTVYNGECVREFMHAKDGAVGMMMAAERGEIGETYNLGTSGETKISIRELALMIHHLANSSSEINFVDDGVLGDNRRCTDSSKARARLQWRHRISLPTGLHRTIEHYRSKVSCQE